MRTLVGALAVVSLAAHLAVLPPTLEDLDSVNFALGVREFDVAQHQPHPPGYPVFIALGKVGTSALARAALPTPDVRGLAIWSALAAGVLPLLVFAFFAHCLASERHGRRAPRRHRHGADRLRPLVWFTAARPLSDLAGLAAAWAALAALAVGSDLAFPVAEPSARCRNTDLTPRWLVPGASWPGCRSASDRRWRS